MKIRLTQSYINGIKIPDRAYWITDAVVPNLRLYVGTTGATVWYVGYRLAGDKRKQSQKLGPAGDVLTVAVAREMANDLLARLARGEDPKFEAKKAARSSVRLGDFLDGVYSPWVMSNRKSGLKTMNMLKSAFAFLLSRPVDGLNLVDIEKWRLERLKRGVKGSTVNRCTAGLLSAINWGVRRGLIETNPLQRLEPLRAHDSDPKVRYLTEDERARLMAALDTREKRLRNERESHNAWLAERGHSGKPPLDGAYADYLKPMVLLSLHTGVRQNNLFSLRWGDVDFASRSMTLRAAVSKSGKTLRLPINSVATSVLAAWRGQSANIADDDLVFPSPVSGKMLNNVKKSWAKLLEDAKIENFRWHDMRHDFASQLVMRGVDLNTVRELMGHASLTMTLRYAHLAPADKLRAAEVLATI